MNHFGKLFLFYRYRLTIRINKFRILPSKDYVCKYVRYVKIIVGDPDADPHPDMNLAHFTNPSILPHT